MAALVEEGDDSWQSEGATGGIAESLYKCNKIQNLLIYLAFLQQNMDLRSGFVGEWRMLKGRVD